MPLPAILGLPGSSGLPFSRPEDGPRQTTLLYPICEATRALFWGPAVRCFAVGNGQRASMGGAEARRQGGLDAVGGAHQFSASNSKYAWGWAQAGQAAGASGPSWT